MASGLAAARAIDGQLRGRRHALPDYARRVEAEFTGYLESHANYYGREYRWPNSLFWRRRHTATPAERLPSLKTTRKPPEFV